MKKFNVTGTCIPEDHYMVDISKKLAEIKKMVDEGLYFTISRPRQYGKTTTMYLLSQFLGSEFIVIKTSFEGIGDDMFRDEAAFCREVFHVFADSVEFNDELFADALRKSADSINNFKDLSRSITKLIKFYKKDIVLIIDEVDKSSGNRVFMQFLGILFQLSFRTEKYARHVCKVYRLAEYLDIQGLDKGYMIVFNFCFNDLFKLHMLEHCYTYGVIYTS